MMITAQNVGDPFMRRNWWVRSAASRLKKSAQSGRGADSSDSHLRTDSTSPSDGGRAAHPLLSLVVLRESTADRPTTLVRGNRTLLSLNLSRNELGAAGMTALLDAVLPLGRETTVAEPVAAPGGLVRLAVHGNRGGGGGGARGLARRGTTPGDVDSTARYIGAMMVPRDPLLRHSVGTAGKTVRSLTNVAEL